MKKKLACMLLMGTLALSMAACGNGQDKNTGAATENSVESTEGAAESTGTSVESTEAGNAGTQQENGDVASALQSAKKAVTDALGDDYWPDAYLGECPMISVNVDTLLIIHAKDGKVEDVENALNAYRDSLVNDTMQYPMNLGKIQASRVERIGDYVCFVQLGADTSSVEEQGDEAVITYCQEQNELALEAIRQTLE